MQLSDGKRRPRTPAIVSFTLVDGPCDTADSRCLRDLASCYLGSRVTFIAVLGIRAPTVLQPNLRSRSRQ